MKKFICIILCILMILTLVSCTDSDPSEAKSETESRSESTSLTSESEPDESTSDESESRDSDPIESEPEESTSEESTSEETDTTATEPVTSESREGVPSVVDPQPALYTPRAMMYHLIRDDVYSVYEALFVRPAEFESHLILLNELGYEYLFADEWRVTERPSVILTLDDGYVDNYTNMFPLIKKYNVKVTVFLVTDLIDTDGYMTKDMIREMASSGLVSFQCHTVRHLDLRSMSVDQLHAEFSKSNEIIEGLTGRKVTALAYPGGGFNDTVLSVAEQYFSFAYTTKSPFSVKNYTELTIPRYYVARGDGRNQFYSFLK